MKKKLRIAVIGIILNIVLFIIKLIGGILSNSLALLSDAFNSLTDILSSIIIFLAVKIGSKKADSDHPFGHTRAEPIAGIIVATFASILGFEIIKNSFEGFFNKKSLDIDILIFSIVISSILIKLYLFIISKNNGKRYKSPALLASSIDHRNDILVSFSVLIGSIFGYFGYPLIDNVVAIFIGLFIIYSGFKIGMGNIDFLMGKKPSDEIIERMRNIASSIDGVKNLNEVRAHYLGTFIQVEMHIEVDKNLSTEKSHSIAKEVQNSLQDNEIVDYAFIHVDPV